MIELNDTLGTYSPGFFRITVDSDGNLYETMNSSRLPTFVHEYIHFIQDVSLTHGLGNIAKTMNGIYSFWASIKDDPSKEISIPVQLTNPAKNYDANKALYALYNGSNLRIPIEDSARIVSLQQKEEIIKIEGKDYVEKYLQTTIFNENSQFLYNLGAIAVVEAMARISQRLLFPSQALPRRLPYNALDLLNEYYGTNYTDIELFSMADAALMAHNPQNPLFAWFAETPIYLNDFSGLGEYYGTLIDQMIAATRSELWPHFAWVTETAIKSIDGIINNTHSKEAALWAQSLIKKATSLRSEDPAFLAKILAEKGDKYASLVQLMQTIGSPLVLNSKSEAYLWFNDEFAAPKNKNLCSLWLAIREIYIKMFGLKDFGIPCQLKEFCRNLTDANYVDPDCSSAPWVKANQDPLCNFGHVWRMWGFQDKTMID